MNDCYSKTGPGCSRSGQGRNDRLLVVPVKGRSFKKVEDLRDLDPRLLDDIEGFFERYNKLHGKAFRVKARPTSRRRPSA